MNELFPILGGFIVGMFAGIVSATRQISDSNFAGKHCCCGGNAVKRRVPE